jgi:hypothetical protein
MGRDNTLPPRWVWRLTLGGTALVVIVTAIGAILLGLRAANPPVVGPVVWSDESLRWASGPSVTLAAGGETWFASPPDAALPGGAFTLDVQARLSRDSGAGAAWGVWLETPDGARVIYAISGEGYTTTRRCDPALIHDGLPIEDCPALRPEWRWFDYPRINPPGASNTITLHVEQPGHVRLRINREIMGIAPVVWTGHWGVWVRGGRDSDAVLTWERATVRRIPP